MAHHASTVLAALDSQECLSHLLNLDPGQGIQVFQHFVVLELRRPFYRVVVVLGPQVARYGAGTSKQTG